LTGQKRNEERIMGGLYFAWTDRWPSATNCGFPVSVFQLYLEPDGKLSHHPAHTAGSLPQDSNVFLP
jgi:hypothetical protein